MLYGYMIENKSLIINEKKRLEPIIVNGINYPEIVKNGKYYRYNVVTKEKLAKVKEVESIVKSALNELSKTEEFKKCAKAVKDKCNFTLNSASLYKEIQRNIDVNRGKCYIDLFFTNPDMGQDVFYCKVDGGKQLADLTDDVFKKLRSKFKPEGIDVYFCDDFYGYDIFITICSEKEANDSLIEIKESTSIQEKARWTFDTQGCMEFAKLCIKKLKSVSGVSKVTSVNNLITIEFESKDKVSKGKSECDKIFKSCLDYISKKYPDKDFSYGLDVVNDNSISYNVDCMKSYEDVKEAAYIQEGFLDKFRKKNRNKKTEDEKPVNKSNTVHEEPTEEVIDKMVAYINQILKRDAKKYHDLIVKYLKDGFNDNTLDKNDPDYKVYYTGKKLPKLHAVNDGAYIIVIDDDQMIQVVLAPILNVLISELKANPEFSKYKYSTGDGDEGCIYFD